MVVLNSFANTESASSSVSVSSPGKVTTLGAVETPDPRTGYPVVVVTQQVAQLKIPAVVLLHIP